MKVEGKHIRSIWLEPDGWSVSAIDQRLLPHDFVVARLTSCDSAADAIRSMLVRGAPLIGTTAAYGVALAMRADGSDAALDAACKTLIQCPEGQRFLSGSKAMVLEEVLCRGLDWVVRQNGSGLF